MSEPGLPKPTEEEPEVRLMDPELFAKLPKDFHDYAAQRPEILPNFNPFAEAMINLIRSRPDEIIVMEGPHGIGKTTGLIPALLRAGGKHGFEPLGSISSTADPLTGGVDIFLDSHDWQRSQVLGFELRSSAKAAGKILFNEKDSHRQQLTEQIRTRFSSSQNGLFVIDELVGQVEDMPWLTSYILSEAKKTGVTLAGITPTRHWENREGWVATYRTLRQASDKTVTLVQIPVEFTEQLAQTNQILTWLDALGLDRSVAEVFDDHPALRRLRIIEALSDALLMKRHEFENDDTIWDKTDLATMVKSSRFFANNDDASRYGLTAREQAEIRQAFIKPLEDLEDPAT